MKKHSNKGEPAMETTPFFKRPLVTSVSLILVAIIVAAVSIYFLATGIMASAKAIAQDHAQLDAATGAVAGVAALKAQAPQAKQYQLAFEKLLPTQDGLIGFSGWINSVANAHGVSSKVVFQGKLVPPSATGPGQAGFSLTVTGDMSNIISFLNDIETKTPGFLLSLSSFDLVNASPHYQVSVQGNVFFR
jgi:hypothetical protein